MVRTAILILQFFFHSTIPTTLATLVQVHRLACCQTRNEIRHLASCDPRSPCQGLLGCQTQCSIWQSIILFIVVNGIRDLRPVMSILFIVAIVRSVITPVVRCIIWPAIIRLILRQPIAVHFILQKVCLGQRVVTFLGLSHPSQLNSHSSCPPAGQAANYVRDDIP